MRKGQLNRHTRYRPATTTRNTDQTGAGIISKDYFRGVSHTLVSPPPTTDFGLSGKRACVEVSNLG